MAKRYGIFIYPSTRTDFGQHHWCQVGVDARGRYILYVEARGHRKRTEDEAAQARRLVGQLVDIDPGQFYRTRFVKALPFEVDNAPVPLRPLAKKK